VSVVFHLLRVCLNHENICLLLNYFVRWAIIECPYVGKSVLLNIQNQNRAQAPIGRPIIDTGLQKNQISVRTDRKINAKAEPIGYI
jgi:hypothetical protein